MKTILVSLVSEQTIPNILVAAHYKPDILWFVSTDRSEKGRKTECIENTLRLRGILPLSEYIKKIVVNQDSLTDCMDKVKALVENVAGEVEYIVNMTGGNKVMAIAAYEVFKGSGQRVKIGYMPLGKNEFMQFFPEKKPLKVYEIKERLNLEEYLMSYGFKIQNTDNFSAIRTKALFHKDDSKWILDNYEQLKGVLGFLYMHIGKKRKEKSYPLSVAFDRDFSQIERVMLAQHGFKINGRQISKDMTKDEIIYLTGGWFEEYVFNEVYSLVEGRVLDDVMLGVIIESLYKTTNELDIAFMKDNSFYHIECKTLSEGERDIIRDEIYKRGAILRQLGLGEKRGIICTTNDQIGKALSARGKEYGVEILSIQQVRDLRRWLSERVNAH